MCSNSSWRWCQILLDYLSREHGEHTHTECVCVLLLSVPAWPVVSVWVLTFILYITARALTPAAPLWFFFKGINQGSPLRVHELPLGGALNNNRKWLQFEALSVLFASVFVPNYFRIPGDSWRLSCILKFPFFLVVTWTEMCCVLSSVEPPSSHPQPLPPPVYEHTACLSGWMCFPTGFSLAAVIALISVILFASHWSTSTCARVSVLLEPKQVVLMVVSVETCESEPPFMINICLSACFSSVVLYMKINKQTEGNNYLK